PRHPPPPPPHPFPTRRSSDLHIKAELGRYRMRGFSLFKKIPTWDDLTFLPGTLTRFVIEGYREKCLTKTVIGPKAKRPLELDIPDRKSTRLNSSHRTISYAVF